MKQDDTNLSMSIMVFVVVVVCFFVCVFVCFCSDHTCDSSQFACGDGTCKKHSYRCDGVPDCKNGADEKGCPGNQNSINRSINQSVYQSINLPIIHQSIGQLIYH